MKCYQSWRLICRCSLQVILTGRMGDNKITTYLTSIQGFHLVLTLAKSTYCKSSTLHWHTFSDSHAISTTRAKLLRIHTSNIPSSKRFCLGTFHRFRRDTNDLRSSVREVIRQLISTLFVEQPQVHQIGRILAEPVRAARQPWQPARNNLFT